ncbi:hypothetical protein ACWEOI_31130 [Nocardia sp. NPDC004340]
MASAFLTTLAGDEEFRFGQQLDGVTLFFELNLDEDEVCRVQSMYGQIAATYVPRYGARALIRKYPALTLVSLIGHAGLAYDQGKYWESFWAELDLARDQEFESALRHELNGLLRRFRLREFPELAGSYVQVMAIHAGIPVHCLGDLVDVIEHHLVMGRERSGAAVFEWLTEPGMDYRLGRLDVPVRQFLRLGGEVAVDIVGRIMDFIEFTAGHPEVWNNLDLDTATTGLPTIMLEGLIERLREQPFGTQRAGSVAASRLGAPVLGYSLADDQITVGIPYPAVAPETPWRVSIGGDTREVYADRGWGVDADHPLTPVPVTRPVREIVLHHDGSAAQHRIVVVDKTDPLLLFDLEGRLLPRRSALPRDVVLAVHPSDAVIVDGTTGAPVVSNEDVRVPVGWRGWRAHTLDVSEHDAIQLRRNGVAMGPVREIRAVGAPSLEFADPLDGVRTVSGLSVYSQRPWVVLPKHRGVEPVSWMVRVRAAGSAEWLVNEEWESSFEDACLDPFDGLPAGLVGHFEIAVNGPLGSDLRCNLFLAEGLSVDHGVCFRAPVPGGLSPSVTRLECDPPLAVDPALVPFDAGQRESRIEVRSGERVHKLVLTPPYFESRVDELGTAARWRTTAHLLTPADLEANAVIAARVPGDVRADFALLDSAGAVLQAETPDVPAEFVFQISSRVFVDTARRARSTRLVVRIDDPTGVSQSVTLARIRPALLCGGVDVEDGFLVFREPADAELGVFVWSTTAPWQSVRQLMIRGGRAELPEVLRDAGPLLVQVFVDDPWVSIPAPSRPDSSALRVDQPGWLRDPSPAREQLSRFLAGFGTVPRSADAVAEVWAALAMMPAGRADSATERLRSSLIAVLGMDARAALEALGGSTIPAAEMVPLVIRTGLAERPYVVAARPARVDAAPMDAMPIPVDAMPESGDVGFARGDAGSVPRDELPRGADVGSDHGDAMSVPGDGTFPRGHVTLARDNGTSGPIAEPAGTGLGSVGAAGLHANPWVGCLVELADLPSLSGRRAEVSGRRAAEALEPCAEVTERRAETLAYLGNQGGEWLIDLLRGRPGDARIGVFDRNVEHVHGLPMEQVDALFEAFRLVPGALLDVDTRTSATIEAFHARARWVRDAAREVLTAATPAALRRIRQVAPLIYDTIGARNEALDGVDVGAHPWMLLSVQSLTMAALARLDAAARFGVPPITSEMREAWARMADLCPAMVATDLLIADALVAFVAHGDLIGDNQ